MNRTTNYILYHVIKWGGGGGGGGGGVSELGSGCTHIKKLV